MRLDLQQPLDIDDARTASRRLAELRRAGEDDLAKQVEASAEAERTYRKALSRAHVEQAGEGTAAEREAKARAAAADAAYDRDLAAGMVKVCTERLRGLEREGAALRSLIEWSQRMYEREVPPASVTYGGQRAA